MQRLGVRRADAEPVAGSEAGPEQAEHPVEFVERLAAGALQAGEQPAGLFRIAVEYPTGGPSLDQHHVQRVPDEIVQLASDVRSLVGHHPVAEHQPRGRSLLLASRRPVRERPDQQPEDQRARRSPARSCRWR